MKSSKVFLPFLHEIITQVDMFWICVYQYVSWHSWYSVFPLCWIGVDNFYDAIEDMIGYRPNSWMKWSWSYITPVLCMVRDERQLFKFHLIVSNEDIVDDMLIVGDSRSQGGVQVVLKEVCFCFPGLFYLLPGEVQALDL